MDDVFSIGMVDVVRMETISRRLKSVNSDVLSQMALVRFLTLIKHSIIFFDIFLFILDVCKLPLVNPDYCSSNMTRYYYDSDILKCKEFTYNGCLGNNNNFKTISECEKSCQIPLLYGLIFQLCLFR